jgi:CHAT domain-containing protein
VAALLATVDFAMGRMLSGFGDVRGRAALVEALRTSVERLDEILLRPIDARLAEADLVVCPPSALASAPWTLMNRAADRVVTVAPSATVWCRSRDRAAPTSRRVLAVAGPGLDGAADEIEAVAGLHTTTAVLTGAEATVRRVLDAVPDADLLHLAAHGRLRRDNPLFSQLLLHDGPLTAYDLESLPAAPADVVLSGCASGAGHEVAADETLGLAWTLLGLGTSCVVAPLYLVPDLPTRDLMIALHEQLARGVGMPRALAAARRTTAPDDPTAVAVAAAFVAFGA